MSVRDMVTGAMGYVSQSERQAFEAKRAEVEKEKAEREKRGGKAVVNSLAGSMMDYAQMRVDANLKAEQMQRAQNRPQVRTRVIREEISSHDKYDVNGQEMDF